MNELTQIKKERDQARTEISTLKQDANSHKQEAQNRLLQIEKLQSEI